MSQFSSTSYDVPRTTGVCASTGRTLEPGEVYYAALVETPDAADGESADVAKTQATSRMERQSGTASLGLGRIDISREAWEGGYRPELLFSFWKSTVPEPNQKKKLFVDDAVLMNLLRRLADAEQPQRLAFRYVLALILMRKKLLRYDGSTRRGETVDGKPIERAYWLLTPKLDLAKGPMGKWNDQDTLEVLDPQLDESQIEQVTRQLGEILEAEL